MKIPFIKMHGLGNDFVIIDGRRAPLAPDETFCRRVADRHRGVGYDQLIVLERPENPQADLFMRMFNADGSQAGACGNATRCVARLLFEETGKKEGVIQTISGFLTVREEAEGFYSVDFGPPRLDWRAIPLAQEHDTLSVAVAAFASKACCVSMGNPHAVFFVPNAEEIDLEKIGPLLEHDPEFPQRANIEFAHIIDPENIRMRVWERGTGVTQACGSGSCATLVAAVRRGLSARKAALHLDGGILTVAWREEDGHVILGGPAALSFSGFLENDLIK